jgi:hypothetical protein
MLPKLALNSSSSCHSLPSNGILNSQVYLGKELTLPILKVSTAVSRYIPYLLWFYIISLNVLMRTNYRFVG